MKKLVKITLASLVLISFLTAFKAISFTTTQDKDFVVTTKNQSLTDFIQANFSDLATEVTKIDIHHNNQNGYYYAVYGKMNGQETSFYLKINETDVVNETYSYISAEVLKNTSAARYYCREDDRFACRPTTSTKGIICGAYSNGRCIIF